jgi:8-oxo-dGTP diphosphatase
MVADGLERIRGKLWYSNIAVGLLPDEFTIAQARDVYELLAGVPYDPANFSRDLRASGLIRPGRGFAAHEGAGRPARLFRFSSKEPTWTPRYGRGTTPQA